MAKVIVGMSGGVDSSVAAYLMQQAGQEVIGLFMKNWHDESVTISDECPWVEDSNDALIVAQQLNIPFQTIDLSAEYKTRIVDYMFAEYEAGRTPNPDVLCNREIKFDVFLEKALELGADFVATGHYCQKKTIKQNGEETYQLIAGKDDNKDQSYFLCQVNQKQLEKAIFPIGHLTKPEVRAIAEDIGLSTAGKKDSQGLCFIGKVRLPDFLQQQLKPKKGNVVLIKNHPALSNVPTDLKNPDFEKTDKPIEALAKPITYRKDDGNIIGEHNGAHFYTIGQRKGLGIGGFVEPLFIIQTNTITNTIFVAEGDQHPALYRPALFIPEKDEHWVRPDLQLKINEQATFDVRIRYRQDLQKAILLKKSEGIYILFEIFQRSIAKGQFAAWYKNNELIGSGVID